jgi:hypothetical protein
MTHRWIQTRGQTGVKLVSTLGAALVLVLSADLARAAVAPAPFSAAVNNSCTLTVLRSGVLAVNTASTLLASNITGGRTAQVRALTTSRGFKVSAIAPTAFTTGDSANTTFASLYTLRGATVVTNRSGSTITNLNRGTHTVTVNLRATRTSGIFPNGSYSAVVTVRCE